MSPFFLDVWMELAAQRQAESGQKGLQSEPKGFSAANDNASQANSEENQSAPVPA